MACSCTNTPCGCTQASAAPDPCAKPRTRCDLYRQGQKNVWVERGDSPNDVTAPGICMLDTMDDSQIIYCLERDEVARRDLLTVTSDPHLHQLAQQIARLPVEEEADKLQRDLNRNNSPASSPFYALFRGQPPFNQ